MYNSFRDECREYQKNYPPPFEVKIYGARFTMESIVIKFYGTQVIFISVRTNLRCGGEESFLKYFDEKNVGTYFYN